MTAIVGGRVRSLKWFADPPRFYEILIGEDGAPVLDADKVPVRTGRVLKGASARALMQELSRDRPPRPDGTPVIGTLPRNWVMDENWEFGQRYLRDYRGRLVKRGGQPVLLPKNQRGPFYGRRHAPDNYAERAVLVRDSQDLVFVTWWKAVYPDIPFRVLSRDYYWYKDDGYVTEVLADDAEIILRGCVGEFLDVSERGDALPPPPKPIVLAE